MSSAIEAMGMGLPYSSSVPAEDPLKKLECRLAGRQVLLLLILLLFFFLVLLLLLLLLLLSLLLLLVLVLLLLLLPFFSPFLFLLLSLMMYDVPLLKVSRQTLRSKGARFQHVSAYCAKLACAHHNNGYQLTTWLLKHISGQAHSVRLLPGDSYKNHAVCCNPKLCYAGLC